MRCYNDRVSVKTVIFKLLWVFKLVGPVKPSSLIFDTLRSTLKIATDLKVLPDTALILGFQDD
jgi:hypothetical protein